jgi:hypothetical protein
MLMILTGTTGSGKTDVSWALVSALPELVFLDCDWFASRSPFSWKRRADVESVYRGLRSQIAFHLEEGRRNFVVTLEMAELFRDNRDSFAGLPIFAFRLLASNDTLTARIMARDRIQKAEELENALRQQTEFEKLCAGETRFVPIHTDGISAEVAAHAIVAKIRSEIPD